MPNSQSLPQDYCQSILAKMKERQKELKLSNNTIADAIDMAHSTFRDIWNSDGVGMKHEFVVRVCLFLGLSIDENTRTPTATSKANLDITDNSHEDVMRNNAKMLAERKERIDELEAEVEVLTQKINAITAEHLKRIDGLLAKNDMLTEELMKRHREILDYHDRHVTRVDKLQDLLEKRYGELFEYFSAAVPTNTLRQTLKERYEKQEP